MAPRSPPNRTNPCAWGYDLIETCLTSVEQVLGKREACDAGTIESPKATVVTYVEQDPEFAKGATVRDAVFAAENTLMR